MTEPTEAQAWQAFAGQQGQCTQCGGENRSGEFTCDDCDAVTTTQLASKIAGNMPESVIGGQVARDQFADPGGLETRAPLEVLAVQVLERACAALDEEEQEAWGEMETMASRVIGRAVVGRCGGINVTGNNWTAVFTCRECGETISFVDQPRGEWRGQDLICNADTDCNAAYTVWFPSEPDLVGLTWHTRTPDSAMVNEWWLNASGGVVPPPGGNVRRQLGEVLSGGLLV